MVPQRWMRDEGRAGQKETPQAAPMGPERCVRGIQSDLTACLCLPCHTMAVHTADSSVVLLKESLEPLTIVPAAMGIWGLRCSE